MNLNYFFLISVGIINTINSNPFLKSRSNLNNQKNTVETGNSLIENKSNQNKTSVCICANKGSRLQFNCLCLFIETFLIGMSFLYLNSI